MEIEPDNRFSITKFVIIVVILTVMAACLGVLIYLWLSEAVQADEKTKAVWGKMAWVAFALLGLTLLVLVWTVVRFAMSRLQRLRTRHKPTPYIDAWSLAGKRLKLEDSEDQDEPEQQE